MANLTITIDNEVLLKARQRALAQGTSVNAILRTYLEQYSGAADSYRRTTEQVLALARHSTANSKGHRWSRDELHER